MQRTVSNTSTRKVQAKNVGIAYARHLAHFGGDNNHQTTHKQGSTEAADEASEELTVRG